MSKAITKSDHGFHSDQILSSHLLHRHLILLHEDFTILFKHGPSHWTEETPSVMLCLQLYWSITTLVQSNNISHNGRMVRLFHYSLSKTSSLSFSLSSFQVRVCRINKSFLTFRGSMPQLEQHPISPRPPPPPLPLRSPGVNLKRLNEKKSE